jgi:hypothetical protein
MTHRTRQLLSLAALACTISNPSIAHHSQAMFEMSKCITIEGTVRTFEYGFPHSWLWVVVSRDNAPAIWAFEAAAPAQMIEINKRWARTIVKKGDKITVQYSPNKDGGNSGALHSLLLPDGTKLLAATPACALEPDAVGTRRPEARKD